MKNGLRTRDARDLPLWSEDARLIDAIDRGYRPSAENRLREAAFLQAVEARLERRPVHRFGAGFAVAALALAVAGIWLAVPGAFAPAPIEIAAVEDASPGSDSVAQPFDVAEAVLAVESDEIVEAPDYLPGEYLLLASFVDAADL